MSYVLLSHLFILRLTTIALDNIHMLSTFWEASWTTDLPNLGTHTLGICMWLQTASRKWEQIKYIIVSKSFELETCNIIRNNMSKTGILPYQFGS
jgi:hypothetical protein